MEKRGETLLDLGHGGRLSPDDAREFNRLCDDVIPEYHDFLARLCHENDLGDAGWWLGVTCRNTFRSRLYADLCRLAYVRQRWLAGRTTRVIRVDTPALADMLARLFAQLHTPPPRVEIVLSRPLPDGLSHLLALLTVIYRLACAGISAWWTRSAHPPFLTALTLVDTFVFPQYFDREGNHLDRHYPGLMDGLSPPERASIRFVPTLLGARFPWQFFRMMRAMRRGPFLLPWDYYRWGDYLQAVIGSLYTHRCIRVIPDWQGLDVSPLVRAELRGGIGGVDLAFAILYARFPDRLREQGVPVRLLIDWWENQVIDRALVMGFRRAYPDVEVIGYQGYVASDRYFCVDPARHEEQAGTLPWRLAVGSPIWTDQRRERFGPLSIAVEPAPLLRNAGVWRAARYHPDPDCLTVLLPLPIDIGACREVVALAGESADRCPDRTIRWWFKPHPSHRVASLRRAVPRCGRPPFILAEGGFDDLAEQTDIVFSSATGSCLEAMAKGCAVIIVGNRGGPTFNPIPAAIPVAGWRLCFDAGEVIEALGAFRPLLHAGARQERARQVREACFGRVSRAGIRHLLRLDNAPHDKPEFFGMNLSGKDSDHDLRIDSGT